MSKTSFTVDKAKLQVSTSRVIDTSAEHLWGLYTDPVQLPHWWGPRIMTTRVDTMDVRVGGAWRFVQHDQNGQELSFNGEYKEVVRPERIVYSFEFEAVPGHIINETITFEKIGDQSTKLTDTMQFQLIEDLEGMVSGGMEFGATESMERLAELAAKP